MNGEQRKHVELLHAMITDQLIGSGITIRTLIKNLRLITNVIERIENSNDKSQETNT